MSQLRLAVDIKLVSSTETVQPGVVVCKAIPALEKLRQEDGESEACLGHKARPFLQNIREYFTHLLNNY